MNISTTPDPVYAAWDKKVFDTNKIVRELFSSIGNNFAVRFFSVFWLDFSHALERGGFLCSISKG